MREKTLDAVSMATDIISKMMDMNFLKGWGAQFVWTGAPIGTISVQSSLNKVDWDDIAGASVACTGVPGEAQFNTAAMVNYPFIRIKYTRTGGTGSLTAHLSGQDIN